MNATAKKYDLYCEAPPMAGEIKICGGDYQPKMKGLILADVDKLRKAPPDHQKFMILVIDTRKLDTPLGRWLISPGFAQEETSRIRGTGFETVIWEIGSPTIASSVRPTRVTPRAMHEARHGPAVR